MAHTPISIYSDFNAGAYNKQKTLLRRQRLTILTLFNDLNRIECLLYRQEIAIWTLFNDLNRLLLSSTDNVETFSDDDSDATIKNEVVEEEEEEEEESEEESEKDENPIITDSSPLASTDSSSSNVSHPSGSTLSSQSSSSRLHLRGGREIDSSDSEDSPLVLVDINNGVVIITDAFPAWRDFEYEFHPREALGMDREYDSDDKDEDEEGVNRRRRRQGRLVGWEEGSGEFDGLDGDDADDDDTNYDADVDEDYDDDMDDDETLVGDSDDEELDSDLHEEFLGRQVRRREVAVETSAFAAAAANRFAFLTRFVVDEVISDESELEFERCRCPCRRCCLLRRVEELRARLRRW